MFGQRSILFSQKQLPTTRDPSSIEIHRPKGEEQTIPVNLEHSELRVSRIDAFLRQQSLISSFFAQETGRENRRRKSGTRAIETGSRTFLKLARWMFQYFGFAKFPASFRKLTGDDEGKKSSREISSSFPKAYRPSLSLSLCFSVAHVASF